VDGNADPLVDHEHQIRAVAVGPIAFAEVESHLLSETQWEGLEYREFIGGRGAGPEVAPSDIRRVVELLRKLSQGTEPGRTAMLVFTGYAFGMMRMLGVLVADVSEIRVFGDEEEVRTWLHAGTAVN
jgi:hypothetical protein